MGFLGDMFSGGGEQSIDNSGAFNDFAQRMYGRMPVYDPWINRGNEAGGMSLDQYKQLINNPNFLQDKITEGFYESPYQKYIQDMVTKRMNYNSANTGMLGSGAANRALQQELNNMTGGFLNDYINRGMQSYGMGIGGLEGLNQLGYKALGDQTSLFEQGAAGQLQGQLSKNAYDAMEENNNRSFWGNILGTAGGAIVGGMFGGPAGASAGSQIGSRMFGGKGSSGGMNMNGMFSQGNMPTFQPGVNSMNGMPVGQGGFNPSNYNAGGWSY